MKRYSGAVIGFLLFGAFTLANAAPGRTWHGSAAFNNDKGCGFVTRSDSLSPQQVADEICAAYYKHQICTGPETWGRRLWNAPGILLEASPDQPTPDVNLNYKVTCTTLGAPDNFFYYITAYTVNGEDKGETCLKAGNPIGIARGNKFQNEQVYAWKGVGNPLSFNITYNSNTDTDKKLLGGAWRSPYDRFIGAEALDQSKTLGIRRPDGKSYGFTEVNGELTASSDKTYSITKQTDAQGAVTGWVFENELTGELELYDSSGILISIVDRAGLPQTFTYSNANTPVSTAPKPGLLIQVSDSMGRGIEFSYDSNSRLIAMTNPEGGRYQYTYSPDGYLSDNLLTMVTFPDQSVKTFHYGEAAYVSAVATNNTLLLTGITDENNDRYVTWTYDEKGRAISSEYSGGAGKVELSYLANGPGETNPINTTVTDGLGTARTYQLTQIQGSYKSTGQSQPAGAGCAASGSNITYDANGNISTKTDFNGNQTTYVYDMSRNLETSRTEGLSNAGAATAATRTITTTWHPTWRLPLVISEYAGASASGTPLKTTTTDYDDKGNITSVSVNDPFNNISRTVTTAYTYSSAVPGLMLSKVVDGPRTDVNDITTYTYYPHDATCTPSTATPIIDPITNTSPENLGCRGQLQSVTNAANQTTTYDRYNHHGQVEQMTDPNGLVTESTYDLRQRITSRTVGSELTSLQYDAVGQLTQLTMPDGSQLSYTYDAAHRLTDIADNQGNKIHYTLDAQGNRINEDMTDPANQLTKTLSRSYDALNRLQQVVGVE